MQVVAERPSFTLRGEVGDSLANRLMSSALSDLHYLAVLTPSNE